MDFRSGFWGWEPLLKIELFGLKFWVFIVLPLNQNKPYFNFNFSKGLLILSME
jgi:hypothetical protein